MNLWTRIQSWFGKTERPVHLQRGALGERAAKKHLKRLGLKFLTANFRSARGEIDLIFRDEDCLLIFKARNLCRLRILEMRKASLRFHFLF